MGCVLKVVARSVWPRVAIGLTVCSAVAAQAETRVLSRSSTVNGVTVRLTNTRWCRLEEAGLRRIDQSQDTNTKGLAVWYEVESADPTIQPAAGRRPADYLTAITTLSEFGRPLDQVWDKNRRIVWWAGVDPRWEKARIEFEFLDPAAPPEAAGQFEEVVEFKDVPLPTKPGESVVVDRSLTTPRGTRVFLEKVGLRVGPVAADLWRTGSVPLREGQHQVVFVVRWLPPLEAPDLHAHLGWGKTGRATEDKGMEWPRTGRGGSIMDLLDQRPGRESLYVNTMPSPDARTVNIVLHVEERAPSLKQAKWFRRFNFDLNLREVESSRSAESAKPLATVEGANLTSMVEAIRPFPPRQYRARLWLRDRGNAGQTKREWRVKRLAARFGAGHDYAFERERLAAAPTWRLLWKYDGTPAAEDETGMEVHFVSSSRRGPAPKKVDLEFEVDAFEKTQRTFNFEGLPLPKPGELIEILEKSAETASGGQLVLRKMSYFDDQHLLPGLEPDRQDALKPYEGLVLVFEYVPPVGRQVQTFFRCDTVRDDRGRSLDERRSTPAAQADALQKEKAAGIWWSALPLPPWPDSKTLGVQVRVIESIATDLRETIKFPEVPLPGAEQAAG